MISHFTRGEIVVSANQGRELSVQAESPFGGNIADVPVAATKALRKRGIDIRIGTKVESVTESPDAVSVSLSSGDTLAADLVLVSVGRGPRTDGLGLIEQGIATERGFVTVDDNLLTTVNGVYAVGDIVAGYQLAHRGFSTACSSPSTSPASHRHASTAISFRA